MSLYRSPAAALQAAALTAGPDEWTRVFGHRVSAAQDCLEFQGSRSRSNYGQVWYRTALVKTHRLSWVLANGVEIPPGLFVMHSCDNPPCINPAHLSCGTPRDNVEDMMSKGRNGQPTGADHPRARLTWDAVATMRTRHAEGAPPADLADEFGVTRACVYDVVTRRTWGAAWVPSGRPRGDANGRARLTADDVMSIRRRRAAGESVRAIARDYHPVSEGAVSDAAIGRTWTHLEAAS